MTQLLQPISNKRELDTLIAHFTAVASEFGFIQAPPTPLLSDDETLLFANSTIAGYKQHLVEGQLPSPGFSIVQECIRNQNLKSIRNWDEELEYMSCFTQLGVLGCPKSLPRILEFITFYLASISNRQHLLCRVSRSLALYEPVVRNVDAWQIEIDGRSPGYYHWQYGLKGVKGEGVTFAILDQELGGYRDIGNLIEISDSTGVQGYEFGFGAETLDSRLRGLESPFESCLLLDYLDIKNEPFLKRKVLDSLMLAATLCAIGVDETTLKRASILRRVMNDLFYLTYLCQLEPQSILAIGREYLQVKGMVERHFIRTFATFERRVGLKINRARQYIDYTTMHDKSWDRARRHCVERIGIPTVYFEKIFEPQLSLIRPIDETRKTTIAGSES
jgi:hypothetical protein